MKFIVIELFIYLQINGISGHNGNQSCGEATEQESNLETVSILINFSNFWLYIHILTYKNLKHFKILLFIFTCAS